MQPEHLHTIIRLCRELQLSPDAAATIIRSITLQVALRDLEALKSTMPKPH